MLNPEFIPIEELDLGVRAYNILKRVGVDSCDDLLTFSAETANCLAKQGMALGLPAAMQIAEAQKRLREMT